MRIVVADSLSRVRFAIHVLLQRQPGLQVVGEAGDAESLIARVSELAPDVVLLDLRLRGMPTADLVRRLRWATGGTRVVMLGDRPEMRQTALEAGGDAFVAKVDPPERLLAAIREIGGTSGDNKSRAAASARSEGGNRT